MAERRRTGRPPLRDGEVSTAVNVKLPVSVYDQFYKLARLKRVSVPEILRQKLLHADNKKT